jgi:endonuclease/exonuclease/phosphatase family metal-dependent hydrolase
MKSNISRRLPGKLLPFALLFAATMLARQDQSARPGPAAVQHPGSNRILIVSLNMHGELNLTKVVQELRRHERLRRADIFLLQEVDGEYRKCRGFVDGLAGSLDMPFVEMPDETQSAGNGNGLATLSRYRLKEAAVIPLKDFDLVVRSPHRIVLAQTVGTPGGDIRIFNLHLDSRVNPEQRLDQLSPVLAATDSETRPVIIGGDFNTADYHWIYHVLPIPEKRSQRDALLKRMAASGFQTPFESTGPTHDLFGLQLDWLFLRKLRLFAAGTQEIDFSDHHAIWAEIGPLDP